MTNIGNQENGLAFLSENKDWLRTVTLADVIYCCSQNIIFIGIDVNVAKKSMLSYIVTMIRPKCKVESSEHYFMEVSKHVKENILARV